MSSSSILRPEILVIGNRSYRINPSSLPSLESNVNQQYQVYREEEEADYYIDNPNDDDEPSCRPQQERSTIKSEEKPQIGIIWILHFHRENKYASFFDSLNSGTYKTHIGSLTTCVFSNTIRSGSRLDFF
jgi:hypothetical protein